MTRITELIEGIAEVTISRVSGNIDPGLPFQITVNDSASGKRVLELRMSARQFAEALTGAPAMDVKAEFISPQGYMDVGLTAWHATLPLHDDFDGQGYSHSHTRLKNLVADSALDAEVGGSEFSVRKHNTGMSLMVYGYAKGAEEAVLAGRTAAANLDTVAANGGWKTRGKGASHHPTAETLERDERYAARRAR